MSAKVNGELGTIDARFPVSQLFSNWRKRSLWQENCARNNRCPEAILALCSLRDVV